MVTPESRVHALSLEEQAAPEGQRISVAYHPYFSRYHHDLHRSLVDLIATNDTAEAPPGRRYPIGYRKSFPDSSPLYAVLERRKNFHSDSIIAPAWIAPPIPDAVWSVVEMSNAFTQSRTGEEDVLSDRFILLLPYAELRQDKNTSRDQRTYWEEEAREAISAQLIANILGSNGVSEAIILQPHSAEALAYFDRWMDTLSLSASPLFAQWLVQKNYVDNHTVVLGLDEGGAQEAQHTAGILTKLTGYDVGVAVLRKDRPEAGSVRSSDLIVGDPGGKRVIVRDDLVSSASSLLTTAGALHKFGCREVINCITHGVLSGDYLRNIAAAQKLGIIRDFAITNSLPQAEDAPFMPLRLEVLNIDEMLAFFARQVAISSIQEVKTDPQWQDYILTPRPKGEVIEELKLRNFQQKPASTI